MLLIGSIGVGLLLLAFTLNLMKILSESSTVYLVLNIIGSFMAALYAWSGNNIPFIVLELAWGITAMVRLVLAHKKSSQTI